MRLFADLVRNRRRSMLALGLTPSLPVSAVVVRRWAEARIAGDVHHSRDSISGLRARTQWTCDLLFLRKRRCTSNAARQSRRRSTSMNNEPEILLVEDAQNDVDLTLHTL